MTTWDNWAAIALGGAIGSTARHGITLLATTLPGGSAAVGTLLANVLGCAAIGALGEYCLITEAVPTRWVLAIRVGFLGSLTTFSTFASETVGLAASGRGGWAFAYVASNFLVGIVALLLSMFLVRACLA